MLLKKRKRENINKKREKVSLKMRQCLPIFVHLPVFVVLLLALLLVGCAETVTEPEIAVQEEAVIEAPEEAPVSEPVVSEPVEEVPSLTAEETVETEEVSVYEEPNLTPVHTVYFTEDGFEPNVINITKGDTVVWINQREKLSALVVGTYTCAKIRSTSLKSGEEFEWTFNGAGECTVIDGIFPSEILKIYIEE